MTTLTIEFNDDTDFELFSTLAQKLNGKVISVVTDKKSTKLSLLNQIENGLKDVKAIKEGKKKAKTLSELLSER